MRTPLPSAPSRPGGVGSLVLRVGSVFREAEAGVRAGPRQPRPQPFVLGRGRAGDAAPSPSRPLYWVTCGEDAHGWPPSFALPVPHASRTDRSAGQVCSTGTSARVSRLVAAGHSSFLYRIPIAYLPVLRPRRAPAPCADGPVEPRAFRTAGLGGAASETRRGSVSSLSSEVALCPDPYSASLPPSFGSGHLAAAKASRRGMPQPLGRLRELSSSSPAAPCCGLRARLPLARSGTASASTGSSTGCHQASRCAGSSSGCSAGPSGAPWISTIPTWLSAPTRFPPAPRST